VSVRPYPWVDWNVSGFAGLSIWDLMGDWTATLNSPWSVLRGALTPGRVLTGPLRKTIERWDALTQRGHVVAIGEIDNHGTRKRLAVFSKTIFPFEFAFRTIRTHVLQEKAWSGQLDSDRESLYEALRGGRSYISLDLWNDPRGFEVHVVDKEGRTEMGGQHTRRGPTLIEVKLPSRGRIRILRNGRVIRMESYRSYMERDVDLPGVYRVEIDQHVGGRWRPWIFSNPIWVQ
jgi:hypothetical protein